MKLVIVESPTKAKTLSTILPKDYKIEASMGHIRDLPKSGLGVDIEHNYEPEYAVPAKAKKTITLLKKQAKDAEEIILATDPDREGEAIAWHLEELLKPKKGNLKFGRVVFHELTESAVKEAFSKLGEINMDLVDAQQARRVLDRLVGYKLSPLLWKKVMYGLSAGRVQSVAVRLVVERERERQVFKPEEYWTMKGLFETNGKENFEAQLAEKQDKKLEIANKESAKKLEDDLRDDTFLVSSIQKSKREIRPYAPLSTSALQQAGSNVFGFTAKRTMLAAQSLFEEGYITYHRTDSLSLSPAFVNSARDFIGSQFGKSYLPEKGVFYKTKSKNAQEAHEAIRPTNVLFIPGKSGKKLKPDELKVYSLIWKRSLECQMEPVVYDQTSVSVISGKGYLFKAIGSQVKFDGWHVVGKFLGIESNGDDAQIQLPNLSGNDMLVLKSLTSEQHFTQPLARYTDATLIKKMEEIGVGRPSTYAPTLTTIQTRGYVEKEGKAFLPKDVAYVVVDLLVEHFPNIVDFSFTADMEANLDQVAEGKKKWVPLIREFYEPFIKILEEKDKSLSKREVTNLGDSDEKCPDCGKTLVFKLGKYGKFLSCSGYPDCKYAKPLAGETGGGEDEKKDYGKCPNCEDGLMILKQGRFGKFIACSNYPKCKTTQNFMDKIGMKCPKCGKGDVVIKKAKRRNFFGCSRYPDCDYSSWKNPKLEGDGEKVKRGKKRESVTSLI
ncbi:MAG: type I DNA topoisomerase [Patescibacteria group bacterium]|nr:type I DNA topoisomerase [Patescibacteria group bacterium]MBU1953294.1 type I DNA topoisomerase [Patescibacteria group bacterium]